MLLSNCAVEIDKKNAKQFAVTLTNESVYVWETMRTVAGVSSVSPSPKTLLSMPH